MELVHFWNVLRRWWWLLLLAGLICAGGTVAYSHRGAPLYRASTRILINQAQSPGPAGYNDVLTSQLLANTYGELLRNRAVLEETISQLSLPFTADTLGARVHVDVVRQTQLLQVSVDDTDPNRAAAIANALVSVFKGHVQSLETRTADVVAQQLDQDIAQLQQRIADESSRLDQLRAATGANAAATAEMAQLVAQIAQYDQDLRTIRQQVADVSSRLNDARANPAGTPAADVKRLQDQLTQYEQDMSAVQQRSAAASDRLNQLRARPAPSGTTADEQALQEQINTDRDKYGKLVESRQNIALAQAQGTAILSVTGPAVAPRDPIQPSLPRTLMLAAFLALLVIGGLALLLLYMDDRMDDAAQVRARFALAPLASIGIVAKRHAGATAADAAMGPNPLDDALRLARLRLAPGPSGGPTVVCVTSPGRKEGKTTIAGHLAMLEARVGRRVVLVDAHLRHPAVHKLFDLPNTEGLSTLLAEPTRDSAPELQDGPDGLLILTSGPVPADPSALLDAPRMSEVLDHLRGMADLIVLDAAPALSSVDALVLQRMTDRTLLVMDLRRTGSSALARALDALEQASAHILGVVVNRTYGREGPRSMRPFKGRRIRRPGKQERPAHTPEEEREQGGHVPVPIPAAVEIGVRAAGKRG
jgi:succinoglycan biosynthesis transport protein ExoP